jgi:hypothetical protein
MRRCGQPMLRPLPGVTVSRLSSSGGTARRPRPCLLIPTIATCGPSSSVEIRTGNGPT